MFVCGGLMKSEVYKRKVDILDELVTRILDAASRIQKKSEDQFRRTTCDFRTRVTADGGLFEHLM
jgi:hypothetical protein